MLNKLNHIWARMVQLSKIKHGQCLLFTPAITAILYLLFGITLVIAFFIPIYADEVAVKIPSPNLLRNGLEQFMLFPQCGDSYIAQIPWAWYPGSLLEWLLNGTISDPMSIRVIGIISFLLWLYLILTFLKTRLQEKRFIHDAFSAFMAMCCLGIMPFLMVFNRGEQSLLLGLTLISLLPFWVSKPSRMTFLRSCFIITIFMFASSFTFLTHAKSLFYAPVLLVSAIFLGVFSKKYWLGTILSGFSILLSYQSYQFWNHRFLNCKDKGIQSIFEAQSLLVSELFHSTGVFFISGLKNLKHSYVYFKNTLFQLNYQSNWLPASPDIKLDFYSTLLDVFFILIFISLLIAVIYQIVRLVCHDVRKKILRYDLIIMLALLLGNVGCAFFRSTKNFYDAGLALPIFYVVALILFTRHEPPSSEKKSNYRIFHILIIMVAIGSLSNLVLKFYPYPMSNWSTMGRTPLQEDSISVVNYANIQQKIILSGAQCGIEPFNTNERLAVDYETYFPFKNSTHLYLIPTVLMGLEDQSNQDKYLLQFLRDRQSAGFVARCDSLPPKLISTSKKLGDYCCMSQKGILQSE
jgi:hypothetical protein